MQRHFPAHCGKGAIEWILEQRLLAAHNHLATSKDASVTETALRCRFLHLGEFSRQFRARFGQSPSDIIRAHGKPGS